MKIFTPEAPLTTKVTFQDSNKYPTRCNVTQFIYICKLLCMFRVVSPPIIRSTYNCIYSIWYLSNRYCYLPLSWKSWNWFECGVGIVSICFGAVASAETLYSLGTWIVSGIYVEIPCIKEITMKIIIILILFSSLDMRPQNSQTYKTTDRLVL